MSTTKSKSPANQLTNLILQDLFRRGIFAWRQNVSGMPVRKDGEVIAIKASGKKGVPDICAIMPPDGRFLGVEVKIGKDSLRPEQAGFHANARLMGAIVLVVNSFEDYIQRFEQLNFIK